MYDIAVVGGGPAGLAAAINARRRNKSVAVIGKEEHSYKLLQAHQIDNYPGLPAIGGKELAMKIRDHAAGSGMEWIKDEIQSISSEEASFSLLGRENLVTAKTVILAVGVSIGGEITGETEWLGQGVSYCATCDGMFFKGKQVAMVGYIPEAEAEAAFLAELCGHVYYLPLYKEVGKLDPRIEKISGRPMAIGGTAKVESFRTSEGEWRVDGVFVERACRPVGQLLADLQTEDGMIPVGLDQSTNIPGVFAAGDCTGRPWQIARAVGQGQIAALSAVHYLENI